MTILLPLPGTFPKMMVVVTAAAATRERHKTALFSLLLLIYEQKNVNKYIKLSLSIPTNMLILQLFYPKKLVQGFEARQEDLQ